MKQTTRLCWASFFLGLLTCATLAVGVVFLVRLQKPQRGESMINLGEICFQIDPRGDMIASIHPLGCYSTSCTRQMEKVGSAVVDLRHFDLHFKARFDLTATSTFPRRCTADCNGADSLDLNLGMLEVGDYTVWLGEQEIGHLMVFSGLPTPLQCLPATPY